MKRIFSILIPALVLCADALALGGSKTPFIGDHRQRGIWAFLGLDAGWTWINARVAGESERQGPDGAIGFTATYYRKRTLYEMGLKLNYKPISGLRTGGLGADPVSAAWEASIRLRYGEAFHAGPFFSIALGEDLSFQPNGSSQPARTTAMMAGLQLLFETRRDYVPMRLGIRLNKYLDVPNRSITGVQVVYQFGFRLSRGALPDFKYNTSDK